MSGLRAGCFGLGSVQITVAILDSGDEGLHGVIVLGCDGIEFVIMTTSAADAEAKEGLADVHDDLINRILPCEALGCIIFTDLAGQQNGRCDEEAGGGILTHRIANELLFDEAIIRCVVIESMDDVVAIRPRIGPLRVHFKTVRVGVAHHIQPVLRPPLAVTG